MLNKIKLKNFKKFQQGEFQFHTGTNILIGANDAGKSTILKAIDIVLSQTGTDDWRNRSAYGTLMNNQAIQTFLSSDKSVANLPKIQIEAWLDLGTDLNNAKFEGMNNSKQKQAQGVLFEYMFDEQFTIDFDQMVAESGDEMSFIPFEFYKATWRTFSGQTYSFRSNPLKSILINNDKTAGDSFSAYSNQLFGTLSLSNRNGIGIALKKALAQVSSSSTLLAENGLGVDVNRVRPTDLLDAYEVNTQDNKLPLRDMGSGTENFVKTTLALKSESKLVLVEEPENHLDFSATRQQVKLLQDANSVEGRQLIITTHSPMIASRLNLKNIIWIQENGESKSFEDIDEETATYFSRLDNVDILQVLMAPKLVLVEGPTEYVLMDAMIEKVLKNSADQLGIHVISMGGDRYKRYVDLAVYLDHNMLIITDNDGETGRIEDADQKTDDNVRVVMPKDPKHFTFESVLYNENESFIDEDDDFKPSKNDYWKSHKGLSKKLVYMLDHKVDAALKYFGKFTGEPGLNVPDYIEDGLTWLNEK